MKPTQVATLESFRGVGGQGEPQHRTANPKDPRFVNYLGSKQRLLPHILQAVSRVTQDRSRVCDLFAGSGSVAVGLSYRWNVTAVDIQEYSRVLCNAALGPVPPELDARPTVREEAERSSLRSELRGSLAGLLALEKESLREAATGAAFNLANILEYGCLLAASAGFVVPVQQLAARQREALDELHFRSLSDGPDTVMTRYYGGVYFTWEQAIDLDSLLARIHETDSSNRDFYLAAALSAASEAVNTVGKQFAQPIRLRGTDGSLKRHLVKQTLRDRSINVLDSFEAWLTRLSRIKRTLGQHQAIRSDFHDALSNPRIEFDTVYADPPYTRDHYSRFYHVLETMALHDEPQVSTTAIRSVGRPRISRGLYRFDRHQSPFCIKSTAPKAFDELSDLVAQRGVPLVLSYSPYGSEAGNRPRLLTVDHVVEILSRHFVDVQQEPVAGFVHNKFNRSDRNVAVDYSAEVLLVCTP